MDPYMKGNKQRDKIKTTLPGSKLPMSVQSYNNKLGKYLKIIKYILNYSIEYT